jgi:lysophospholipase L1-like esterase
MLMMAANTLAQAPKSASLRNPATTPASREDAWWTVRHTAILDRLKNNLAANSTISLVFLGDSITQNYEKQGPPPNEVFAPIWQQFFAPHGALNLGYSGDQTQHVLWRLQHSEIDGLAPENIVLLIGTNNTADTLVPQTAEQVAAGVMAIVDDVQVKLPKAKILVLGILPSGISAAKSAADQTINTALRSQYSASTTVTFLDLSALFMKNGALDAALFYDPKLSPARPPLHPNTQGQRMMAIAVARALYGLSAPSN